MVTEQTEAPIQSSPSIRFDRNELAGALGDIGTDLPLLAGIIIAAKLDPVNVLVCFGIVQIFSGLIYRMPMPVQPLKAMAALVIAQGIQSQVIAGAGLAIGAIMLVMTLTGMLECLVSLVPPPVVRGIQVGLGAKLCFLALVKYIPVDGIQGWALAGICVILCLLLMGNRKLPAGLILLPLGAAWACLARVDFSTASTWFSFRTPELAFPGLEAIITGTLVLALPQLPLSLSNSVVSTHQLTQDLFPERPTSVRRIGFTYSIANLLAPLFGGFPVCHGAGGLAGHHAFGGRTGGSVIIYGTGYLLFGLFLSQGFSELIHVFPLPVLGVVLLFEGSVLIRFARDQLNSRVSLAVVATVAVIAVAIPYGFLIGVIVGSMLMPLTEFSRKPQLEKRL